MSDKHRNAALRAASSAFLAELVERLLPPMREAALGFGYAIAVHGSLARDVDLVAIPWTESAADPDVLVESLVGVVRGVVGRAYTHKGKRKSDRFAWAEKPHGRRAVLIHHAGFIGEIDLSVMPRLEKPKGE